jgi:hypothetical protein
MSNAGKKLLVGMLIGMATFIGFTVIKKMISNGK